MSKPLSRDEIIFEQRFLKSGGFYTDIIDGDWGDNSEKAYQSFLAETEQVKKDHGSLDSRSEKNIVTLQIPAQILARQSLAKLLAAGLDAKIISGLRTYAEQDALYAIGRTVRTSERTVTNAEGGESNHNFGIAWDIGLFKLGKYLTDSKSYESAAKVAKLPGLEWGGDWVSFKDTPHYQLVTGRKITDVRDLFEAGKKYW
jgi:peptidoglycan L-alanyl-D-glutamate endopeptidase CwlK